MAPGAPDVAVADDRPPGLVPLRPTRVWRTYLGGRVLDELEGAAAPRDDHWPEDWWASTTRAKNPGSQDPEEGLTIAEVSGPARLSALLERHPEALLGAEHVRSHGPRIAYLVKVLDAAERLQVQAHPTRAFAREHLGEDAGKAEGYYILSTRPEVAEPHIFLGFAEAPTPAQWRDLVQRQDVPGMLARLNRIPVTPGDAFFVPGAVPHAIGAGVTMIEIMEASDLVARFEYARESYTVPPEGRFMGRDLEFALRLTSFEATSPAAIRASWFGRPETVAAGEGWRDERLLGARHTDRFGLRRLRVNGTAERAEDGFYFAYVVAGRGRIRAGAEVLEMATHDRVLVPAHTEAVTWEADTPLEVALAFPPA